MSGWLHVPTALPGGRSHSVHLLGSWVGPRALFDILKKRKYLLLLLEIEPRSLERPARSFLTLPTGLFPLPVQAEDEPDNDSDFSQHPKLFAVPSKCI